MCEVLKEIMKPELDEAVKEARLQERIKVYYKFGKFPKEIAEMVLCPLDYVKEVLNM
ncbi:MAG: hypothetical protein PUC12_17650 [Clostridiales bacterium]|nr:hypothetical protein [Clostridiales bacterium]